MQLTINLHLSKKLFIALLSTILLIALGLFVYLKISNTDPVPRSIQEQARFKIIYSKSSATKVNKSSYSYKPAQKILDFSTSYSGSTINFIEEATPSNLGSNTQAYYPLLGIHPYAEFQAPLGLVALTKFWQSQSLTPFGELAILVSDGTLLTVSSSHSLSNQQWKSLFDNLKISQ